MTSLTKAREESMVLAMLVSRSVPGQHDTAYTTPSRVVQKILFINLFLNFYQINATQLNQPEAENMYHHIKQRDKNVKTSTCLVMLFKNLFYLRSLSE